jgi:hypothetical protein
MRAWGAVLVIALASGCYSGARAERGVNEAWRGRAGAEIEGRWGPPAARSADQGGAVLRWEHSRTHVDLPSAEAEVSVGPGGAEMYGRVEPGQVWTSTTGAVARIGADGTIVAVEGASLRWGPPGDANLRWGTILGLHLGMGRLDDTSTPLPSGGLYIGGMLSPTLGLVGTYSLVSGRDEAGGAMGMAAGVAAQFWPVTRLSLRAGPALVLDFDPGFEDATLSPGLTGAAGFAWLRVGTLVLDLRLDLTVSPSATFGSLGVGINLN